MRFGSHCASPPQPEGPARKDCRPSTTAARIGSILLANHKRMTQGQETKEAPHPKHVPIRNPTLNCVCMHTCHMHILAFVLSVGVQARALNVTYHFLYR